MAKKMAMIVAGLATAGVLAAAPMAFATEGGHEGAGCAFTSNGAGVDQDSTYDSNGLIDAAIGKAQAAGSVDGNTAGNVGDCSSFLNDNVRDNGNGSANDNFSNNSVDVPELH